MTLEESEKGLKLKYNLKQDEKGFELKYNLGQDGRGKAEAGLIFMRKILPKRPSGGFKPTRSWREMVEEHSEIW